MTGLSNIIEVFIRELLEKSNTGTIEIQRNEMAEQFECSPSQINYVLSTRFTPYKGYYIESRRGGGGYIRLIKVKIEKYSDLNETIMETIGKSITKSKAYHIIEGLREEGFLEKREEEIIKAAVGDRSISGSAESANKLRARILRNILLILAK
ncbi:MAG: CtsR family transcriptional regulator [Tissierella sp.]|uniref:CtsR family transcriptional regulator n=1 Tax=Tissierella sp. TaxID=41274 RepID=UPI003F95E01C